MDTAKIEGAHMRVKFLLGFGVALLGHYLLQPAIAFGAERADPPLERISVGSASMAVVATLLAKSGNSCGVLTPWNLQTFAIDFSGGSVADFLNGVLKEQPSFRWERQGAVVLLSATDAMSNDAVKVLQSTIPTFSSSNFNASTTIRLLVNHAAMAGLGVASSNLGEVDLKFEEENTIVAAKVNVTVPAGTRLIDALNEVIAFDRQSYWWARFKTDRHEGLSIRGSSMHEYSGLTAKQMREIEMDRRDGRRRHGKSVYSEGAVEE